MKGKKSLDFSTPSNKLKKLPGNQLGSRDTTSTQSTGMLLFCLYFSGAKNGKKYVNFSLL